MENGDVVRVSQISYNQDISNIPVDQAAKEFIVNGLDNQQQMISIADVRAVQDIIDTAQLKEGGIEHAGEIIFESPDAIEQIRSHGFEPLFSIYDEKGNLISQSHNPPAALNNGETVRVTAEPEDKDLVLPMDITDKVIKVENLDKKDSITKEISKAL